MKIPYRTLSAVATASLLLSACGGDDKGLPVISNDNAGAQGPALETLSRYVVYTTDNEGNVSVFTDTGATTAAHVATVPITNEQGEPVQLGELHVRGHSVGVVIQSGLTDGNGIPTGGGLAVLDRGELEEPHGHEGAAEEGSEEAGPHVDIIPLISAGSANSNPSRIVHSYPQVDADGRSNWIWMSNDGIRASTPEEEAVAALPDSIFRVNWSHHDEETDGSPGNDVYKDVMEIELGNGHKQVAFADVDDTNKYVVVHNLGDRTLSIIDNNPASGTFMSVIKTVDLGADNVPHGIGFSPASGHVYTGLTAGIDAGLSILDANTHELHHRAIAAGTGIGQVPASGYVKVDTDAEPAGRWVYTVGYKAGAEGQAGRGTLSIIDAYLNDAVAATVDLGDMKPSRIEIARVKIDDQDRVRLLIPSEEGGASSENVVVVDLDPANGQVVGTGSLHIGMGGHHRRSALSADGLRAYFSVNTCGGHVDDGHSHGEPAAPAADMPMAMAALNLARHGGEHHETFEAGEGCTSVAVVDVAKGRVVGHLKTPGGELAAVNVIRLDDVPPLVDPNANSGENPDAGGSNNPPVDNGGGDGHTGHTH